MGLGRYKSSFLVNPIEECIIFIKKYIFLANFLGVHTFTKGKVHMYTPLASRKNIWISKEEIWTVYIVLKVIRKGMMAKSKHLGHGGVKIYHNICLSSSISNKSPPRWGYESTIKMAPMVGYFPLK
jgi:hypothetical protein